MYQKLVEHLKNGLLEHYKMSLSATWMEEKRKVIDEEVNAEIIGIKTEWARKNQCPIPKKNQTVITVEGGYQVDEQAYYHLSYDYYGIHDSIRQKYSTQFTNEHWNAKYHSLQQRFEEQLKKLELEQVIEQFLARHSWLKEELESNRYSGNNTSIAYNFLYEFSQEQLGELDKPHHSKPWSWQTIAAIQSAEAKWPAVDKAKLAHDIEGFPYKSISNTYCKQDPALHNAVEATRDLGYTRASAVAFINLVPKRIDLLRYLVKHFSSHTQADLIDNIFTPGTAPYSAEELDKLSKAQLQHLNTLIINIGLETAPIWISLSKTTSSAADNWEAYIPESLNNDSIQTLVKDQLSSFIQRGNKVTLKTVDYKVNTQQNNIQKVNDLALWHAVLLGRVVPWQHQAQAKRPPLSQYRDTIPVSLFLELAHKSFHPDNKGYLYKVDEAFSRRAPLSNVSIEELLAYLKSREDLLTDSYFYTEEARETKLMTAFDQQQIILSASTKDTLPDQLKLVNHATESLLKHALFVIYHNENITKLIMPAPPSIGIYNLTASLEQLFNLNTSLLTVQPTQALPLKEEDNLLSLAMQCAARNRFLSTVLDSSSWKEMSEQSNRFKLWRTAGREMVHFYNNQDQYIDLDFINEYQKLTAQWRTTFFDHSQKPSPPKSQSLWTLAQIAQMGIKGLDEFFEHVTISYVNAWDNTFKEPAPNLPAVFDLVGSLNSDPVAYTRHLKNKIKELDSTNCSPLFKSLSFILPPSINSVRSELVGIFELINRQKMRLNDAVSEITLYNLPISSYQESKKFLEEIELLAQDRFAPLQILIHLPDWDRQAFSNTQNCELKAKYKAIQNLILENQRQAKFAEFTENTKNIHLLAKGEVRAELILEEHAAIKPQPWSGEDITYPLTAQAPGLQQQLQQAVEQEYMVEEEQEQEQEQEQAQKIEEYASDEGLLITRKTIDETASCTAFWDAIPEQIKQFSGWEQKKLQQLFSLWVGSTVDAAHVIKKIEPAAVEKIMKHASSFRLGISRDNLPAGFYLAYSRKDRGIILCYDKKREQLDLKTQTEQVKEKQNPFTVQFYEPMKPQIFRGDFRQFSPVSSLIATQKLLWNYVATDDHDQKRLDNALNTLKKLAQTTTPENALTQMQEYTFTGKTTAQAGTLDECRAALKIWAQGKLKAPVDVLDALFDSTSQTVLTADNLFALGQVFYAHEVIRLGSASKNASDSFFVLAQQIQLAFGPQHFATWKRYFIDSSQNLNECLTKEEIDHVALSIVTLKENKPLHNIWWALIAAHGKSTGLTRYSPLWRSFQKLLAYTEKHGLILNEASMLEYLNNATDFQAQVFLDRLYRVLRNSEKELLKQDIQQDILNNIHHIDWHHNGFYYASHYEKYPYWYASLKLTEFTANDKQDKPSYLSNLDNIAQKTPQDLVISSLRYLSQQMRILTTDFDWLQEVINRNFVETGLLTTQNGPLALRLLVVCLSQGLDRLSHIDEELIVKQINALQSIDTNTLTWLNQQVFLDGEVIPGSWQVKFEHLASLANAIQTSPLKNKILSSNEGEEFINSCGRALQCYASKHVADTYLSKTSYAWLNQSNPEQSALSELFTIIKRDNLPLDNTLLSAYPWLLLDNDKVSQKWNDPLSGSGYVNYYFAEQQSLLNKQLRSIDFAKSSHLPSYQELLRLKEQMRRAYDSSPRKQFVTSQLEKGCSITNQDAAYRLLNPEEQKTTYEYLSKYLKINFKTHNIDLCERLFNECIAVSVESAAVHKRLEALLKLLVSIDNKPHFNDLGQVLGLLIEQSKAGVQKYYSLEQLTSYLECLIDKEHAANDHYPIHILTTILQHYDNPTNQNASLLNSNLNKLRAEIHPRQLKENIANIVCSELPNQYKPILTKFALHHPDDSYFINQARGILQDLHEDDANPQWIKGIGDFISAITDQELSLIYLKGFKILEQISFSTAEISMKSSDLSLQDYEYLRKLWEDSQLKLIEIYQQQHSTIDYEAINFFALDALPKDAYIRMIILQALELGRLNFSEELANLSRLKAQLRHIGENELRDLAVYCHSLPVPSIELFTKLTDPKEFTSTERLIHRFETVEQAIKDKEKNTSKRHYSITARDNADLTRVLQGLKQKGHGVIAEDKQKKLLELLYYVNAFSQVNHLGEIHFNQLQELLLNQRNVLLDSTATPDEKSLASARMLACMREVLLRKTGKWTNHTQMLDLIYAAQHNNESLLHQVRTGQGKSIISLMRVSYLALNGLVVDIFSSKDSLSKRDQEEFSHVLDAIGIRNSYITPSSPADKYQTNDDLKNLGAVNFCTIGNASLFQSTQIWQHIENINLDAKLRVAFVDECDFVLKFEDTQFNYSANNGAESIYNFDEWVYRIAYKYFIANKDSFPQDEQGVLRISRNIHLKALCELLQQEAKNSPKQSDFIERYIVPAAEGDLLALAKRDNILKKLLVAANSAQNLKEGVSFCIRPDQQIAGQRTVINTRFAKVLIGNQIKHGSTYSELVHQFLHVRLNEEAIAKGQAPNFFVEPDSQVALSSNAKYDLKKYYQKLEGCTGTAGNEEDLKLYEEVFGIKHVVKLPAHEELRSKFLGVTYAEDKKQQIDAIITQLLKFNDRPILMTCEDDIAVKQMAALVKQELERRGVFNPDNFIIDTNDSGLAESEVVPRAGAAGRITISSRMGRGTDIKPETEAGLMVLRTYPTLPQIVKQETGRQGRNGAKGTSIDIINYSEVLKEHALYNKKDSPLQARFSEIMTEEEHHLAQKLQKHLNIGSEKWKWLADSAEISKKYLITRSLQQFKYELKKENELYLRRKEFLIASLSGDVAEVIKRNFDNAAFPLKQFKENWLECNQKIEALWNIRLAGKAGDSEEVYAEFIKQVAQTWDTFCLRYTDLNSMLLKDPAKAFEKNIAELYNRTDDEIKKVIERQIQILTLQKKQNLPLSQEAGKQLKILRNLIVIDILAKYELDESASTDRELFERATHLRDLITDVLHDKVRASSATKKQTTAKHGPEFKSVVSFYQEWIKGAEQYYFSTTGISTEILHAIYGEAQTHLPFFFQSIYEASIAKNKEATKQLFDALSSLPKPQLFLVPIKNLANTIVHLSAQAEHPDFQKHLDCLTVFFNIEQLQKIAPKTSTAEDLEKIGLLLNLVMNISTPNFSEQDSRKTVELITTLSQRIHEDFWPVFDEELAKDIEAVFTYSPETTALLTEKTLDLDLYHIISSINQNKTHALREQRIEQIGKYLHTHHEELAAGHLGVLRPLFEMVLGGGAENYLPDPQVLAGLPIAKQKEFWNFIAQRQPVAQKSVDELVRVLHHGLDTAEFEQQIFTPMMELPPYVSIDYIAEHLKGNISRTNLNDGQRALAQIKEAARAFTQFAHQTGLIAANQKYSHKTHALYADFIKEFNQFSPEENKLFFTLCAKSKYTNLPLDSLLALCKTWKKNGVHDLHEHLSLAVEVMNLSADCRAPIMETYTEGLNDDKSLDQVKQFMTQIKGHSIGNTLMTVLWQIWNMTGTVKEDLKLAVAFAQQVENTLAVTDNDALDIYESWLEDTDDEKLLDESLAIVKDIADFDTHYPNVALRTGFIASTKNPQIRVQYQQFLHAVKNQELNEASVLSLSQAWFSGRIANLTLLQQTIKNIQLAQQLQKKENWADYFMYATKNKAERQGIMQLLHHNILDLGTAFAKRCYDEYEQLALREIKTPEHLSKMTLVQRKASLTTNFKKIVAFAQEITNINSDITPESNPKKSGTGVMSQNSLFFSEQQASYKKAWWVNSARKQQANALFKNLSAISTNNKANFYQESLQHIRAAQIEILETDVGTTWNKKGYSRLYDITVQMSIHLMKQYIADADISIHDKLWLNDSLQEQIDKHISLLAERLPDNHEYKALLGTYTKDRAKMRAGSTEFMVFQEQLQEVNSEKVPKHLRYLVTNIGYFMDVSGDNGANKENKIPRAL